MFTYQSVVDLARIPLNDIAKDRYPDDVLLVFANQGVMTTAKRRPDLFVGQFGSMPNGEALLTDPFPLPPEDSILVADFIVARAELTDDEHVSSGRAAAFAQLYGAEAPV